MSDHQVIIAGGGPVGLAAAVELGRRGVQVLVVEPRTTVSHARPRCKTISVRSMEHLRRWGIADQLRSRAPLSADWSQEVVFCTSLTGRELSRFSGVLGLVHEGDRFPELGQQAPQYVLEELLRDVVRSLPTCTLLTGSSVTGLDQGPAGVSVTTADAEGTPATYTAEYLIGCDGPRSTVRSLIGAHYDGEHALRPNFGMVFEAPALSRLVPHGPAVHYWVVNPAAPALLGPIDRDGTWWMIAFGVDRETGEREARRLIDAAAGAPVDAVVRSTDPWTARMQIADRMRDGRVFLAGDAAHLNPPFGGHGLNTGLGDAVDLGWKLAAVLDGWGGPALLDSYEQERRPIQERVIREATANMAVTSTELLVANLDDDDPAGELARAAAAERIQATKQAEFHSLDLVLDLRIEESAVIPESLVPDAPVIPPESSPVLPDASGTGADPVGARAGLVGVRLPHVWLDGRSLYDALGPGFTLLSLTTEAKAEADGVEQAARGRGVPLTAVDLSGHRLRQRYPADLLLVRPDQYIAWAGHQVPDAGRLLDLVRGAAPAGLTPTAPR